MTPGTRRFLAVEPIWLTAFGVGHAGALGPVAVVVVQVEGVVGDARLRGRVGALVVDVALGQAQVALGRGDRHADEAGDERPARRSRPSSRSRPRRSGPGAACCAMASRITRMAGSAPRCLRMPARAGGSSESVRVILLAGSVAGVLAGRDRESDLDEDRLRRVVGAERHGERRRAHLAVDVLVVAEEREGRPPGPRPSPALTPLSRILVAARLGVAENVQVGAAPLVAG